ncbi:MAG: sigma 54-interacting transcriptional regulator [Synergistaceae bacterium]|nr:sigma 54-interacting transcriptional regulator [Synergistaceae bacterium]
MPYCEDVLNNQKDKKKRDGGRLSGAELDPKNGSDPGVETILGSDYDVTYRSDANGVTQKVSKACEELWGLKPEDIIGRSVFDLERDGIYKPSITRMVLETGERVQSIQVTQTGRKLLVVGTPIKNEKGGIIQIVNFSWNITTGPLLKDDSVSRLFGIYDKAMTEAYNSDKTNRFVYASESMALVAQIAMKVSEVNSTVLITGESGTGKEVIASFIHSHSKRSGKPFVKINCAAIPEQLLESEFFGYEKGAFTGASRDGKPGVFELAEKGTLLLDEISEIPPSVQAKLLRVLQDGSFMKVGGARPVQANVRIIAATNRDLELEMREGRFREDLFYRLNVVPIHLPPLRKRAEDIPILTMFFLKYYNRLYNKNKIFDAKTIMRFQEYGWRGNIRELQNIVERLVVLTDGDMITLPDFGFPGGLPDGRDGEGVMVSRIMPLKDAVSAVERQLINMAMEKFGGTTKAAEVLGVNQSTISRKLKKA